MNVKKHSTTIFKKKITMTKSNLSLIFKLFQSKIKKKQRKKFYNNNYDKK